MKEKQEQLTSIIKNTNLLLYVTMLGILADVFVHIFIGKTSQPLFVLVPVAIKLICGFKSVTTSIAINDSKGLIKYLSLIIVILGSVPSSAMLLAPFFLFVVFFYLKLNNAMLKNISSIPNIKNNSQPDKATPDNKFALLAKRPIPLVKFIQSQPGIDGQLIAATAAQLPDGTSLPIDSMPVMCSAKGCLGVMYAVDENNSFSYINNKELRDSNIDTYELHEWAFSNIESMFINQEISLKVHNLKHAHAITAGGDYESSILLFDEVWDQHFKQFIPNNAVVAVPTRDVCAFCDSHSEEGIKELLGVINNIKQSTAVTISDSLLIRKGNTWHPYSLQENYV